MTLRKLFKVHLAHYCSGHDFGDFVPGVKLFGAYGCGNCGRFLEGLT